MYAISFCTRLYTVLMLYNDLFLSNVCYNEIFNIPLSYDVFFISFIMIRSELGSTDYISFCKLLMLNLLKHLYRIGLFFNMMN